MQNTLLIKFKNFYHQNQKLILSITIFLIVFIALGLPYTNWWLGGCDDASGLFIGYKTKTWSDFFNFFRTSICTLQSSEPNTASSFFSAYYRPLYCVYLKLQYWLFGTNIYFYNLTNVLFHAINSVLIFNISLFFVSGFPALLASMFFAFHPQIAYRFGAVVNLHYYINVMFILLLFIFFKKYLDSKKILYYFLSCFLFLLSLFTRESTIVLPPIIMLGAYLYESKTDQNLIKNFFKNFLKYLKITLPFWLIDIAFLSLRAYLFPIKFSQLSTNKTLLVSILKAKIAGAQVCLYDFLGLSWLPWGHKLERGIIVISLFTLLIYLFIKNTKKIYIFYFLFATALMLWPAFIGNNYCPRYFYEAHPFAIIALILLFKYSDINLKFQKILLSIFAIYIIFLVQFCMESFTLREQKMMIMKNATYNLLKNPKIKQHPLIFLDCPLDGFGGNIPFFWILLNNPFHKIYCTETLITQADSHLVKPEKWKNVISKYFDKNYVLVKRNNNEFNFTTTNPGKVHFILNEVKSDLGEIIINKKVLFKNQEVVTDFTLIIDKEFMQDNPLFIRWNYKTQAFEIMQN